MKKIFFYLPFISGFAFGQTDTIQLNSLVLSDHFLANHTKSQSTITLNDSIIEKNPGQLTQLLQTETPIYFKENGRGMVSSPSFRGTLASHTAVVWNGININSNMNGQTDFNLFGSNSYDGIIVKPGGGSIGYGTSAIGGTIHLLNKLDYNKGLQQKINLGYGSFDTWNAKYQLNYSTEKFSSAINYIRNQSDNDYKTPNYLEKNRNGKYYFNTINANFGYRIDDKHEIKLTSMFNFGKREFPITDFYATPTSYKNGDYRLMTEWNYHPTENWQSELKLAYIKEENSYFENIHSNYHSDLQVDNYILRYFLTHHFNQKFQVSLLSEAVFNEGSGDNYSHSSSRNSMNFALIAKHQLTDKLNYEASVRQDFSNEYNNPFIYSLGLNYRPIKLYQLRFNFSKNFRNPTFNDLFWMTGGNPNLKSESSTQFELGNDIIHKNLKIQSNLFYNKIQDMIQWIPSQNSGNYWIPVNVNEVETYGLELIANYKWNALTLNSTYAYTHAKDLSTSKDLIYTPNHKLTLSAQYTYKKFSAFMQNIYTSKVFTLADESDKLKDFWVTNIGLNYTISPNYNVWFKVNNIFDSKFQTQQNRWQPGINYNIQMQINF